MRALMVTRPGFVRTSQGADMLHGLGCTVDILCVGNAVAGAEDCFPDARGNFAVADMEPSRMAEDDQAATLTTLLHGLSAGQGHALIYLAGLDLPEAVLPGTPRIFDAGTGGIAVWPRRAPDLFLAADERLRQLGAGGSEQSARWPLAMTGHDVPVNPRGPVGWPGALDGQVADGWQWVLRHLEERLQSIPGALMLDISLPLRSLYRPCHVDPSSYSPAAQIRSLALGVLPTHDPDGHFHTITALIDRGVPVLTTPAVAERFEDRWKLPVSPEHKGLAGWVEGWANGRDVDGLLQLAAETRTAFREDAAAMTAYVGDLVAGLMSGPQPAEAAPA